MTDQDSRWAGPAGWTITRLAMAAVLAGLASVPVMAAGSGQADGLSVSDAWMRFIIAARPAGGYFVLDNSSDSDRNLVGASSPGCGELMLHKSESQGGQETMAMVDSLTVPAHGSVSFAPGGYHLMCMHPADTLRPGASVPVTLQFKDGTTLTTDFPVRNAAGK